MSVQSLKKLAVWKRAKDFALTIYHEVLPKLPPEEKWGLAQQIRRSTVSIAANIAEGQGRFHYQDNVRFCYIARGSLEETLSHLVFCYEAGFIPADMYLPLEKEGEEIEKMLFGYIAYLMKAKQGVNKSDPKHSVGEEPATYDTQDFDLDTAPLFSNF
jgi:four helix bundle protein